MNEKEYTQNIQFGFKNDVISWRWITVWCDIYCILVLRMRKQVGDALRRKSICHLSLLVLSFCCPINKIFTLNKHLNRHVAINFLLDFLFKSPWRHGETPHQLKKAIFLKAKILHFLILVILKSDISFVVRSHFFCLFQYYKQIRKTIYFGLCIFSNHNNRTSFNFILI